MKKSLILGCFIFTSNIFACTDGSNDMPRMQRYFDANNFIFSEKALEILSNSNKPRKITITINDKNNPKMKCWSNNDVVHFKYGLLVDGDEFYVSHDLKDVKEAFDAVLEKT
jgi:hypothetical protein